MSDRLFTWVVTAPIVIAHPYHTLIRTNHWSVATLSHQTWNQYLYGSCTSAGILIRFISPSVLIISHVVKPAPCDMFTVTWMITLLPMNIAGGIRCLICIWIPSVVVGIIAIPSVVIRFPSISVIWWLPPWMLWFCDQALVGACLIGIVLICWSPPSITAIPSGSMPSN